MVKKKRKFTKEQLKILFECWKNGNNTKEWLELIAKNLPKIAPLVALSMMRSLVKTDVAWQKAATKKKNKKEKEKREKKTEKETKRIAAAQKKQEKEKRRAEKIKVEFFKEKLLQIKQNLKSEDIKILLEKINIEYFFCSNMDQFVNNVSCIFKIFSNEYSDLLDSKCEKCEKMNKYIPVLEEIANARPKKTRRHRSTEDGSKIKEKDATSSERTGKSSNNI